ncbi:hypothetical protein BJ508DRAFT_329007, partial [Ascobolus immersus RN42]
IRPATKPRRLSLPALFAKRPPAPANTHITKLQRLNLTPTAEHHLATLSALLYRSQALVSEVKKGREREGDIRGSVEELREELDGVRKAVWEGDVVEVGGGEVEVELKRLVGVVEGELERVVRKVGRR